MTKVTPISLDTEDGLGRPRIHLREISGDSEAPLETVGQDLRAARLRRGDDLATVSRALKIRKDHLEAVEEDNFEGLPGKTYAIGFVRTYSGYLGLDAVRTVERYKQEISGRHEEHPPASAMMHDDESRRLPYGWRIVAGIVLLAMAYGVWHLLSAGPSQQPVPPAPVLNPPRPAQTVSAAPPAPVSAAPAPAPATGDSAVPPPAANTAPPPAAAPALSNPAGNPDTAAAATAGQARPGPAVPAVPPAPSAGTVYGQLNANPRVILRARGDARITVRGPDGTLYINRALKAGDSYMVPNETGLSLATSDAGAVEIDLDGIAMGRAGAGQQVLGRVSLDPQSLVDRFNTH